MKTLAATLLILMAAALGAQDEKCSNCDGRVRVEHKFCTGCGAARPAAEFEEIKPEKGTGRILIAQRDARSAKKLFRETLDALAGRLGRKPKAETALVDRDDSAAEGFFRADGNHGLILIQISGKKGLVVVLLDRADRFEKSMPTLMKSAQEHLPQAKKIRWQTVRLPGHSGSLKLPEGWEITAANDEGTVGAKGPQGYIDLGAYTLVATPALKQQFPYWKGLVASLSDPATALQELFPQLSKISVDNRGPSWKWVRLIEQAPADFMPGKAAFLHVEWLYGGEKYQTVVLLSMQDIGDGTWLFYSSCVGAPAKTFAQNLPVLLQIWASWKVSDRVFQRRLQKAMESMKRCSEIVQEVIEYRREVFDKANENWSRYIRGRSPMRDDSGNAWDVPNEWLDDLKDQGWTEIPPGR